MKIHALKRKASSPSLNLNEFSEELRVLSDRYDLKLVSVGAMATTAESGGTLYLAVWSTGGRTKLRLKSFGANVRRVRTNKNLTQERLAELADLNLRTIQKIEAGQLNILLTTLIRIQRALKCPWDKLVGY